MFLEMKGEMLLMMDRARDCVRRRMDYPADKTDETVAKENSLDCMLRMNLNENPLGVSPMALTAMIAELQASPNRYPDSLCPRLAQKLAAIHGVDSTQLLIENGADAVISLIGMTFLEPEDEVVYGELTFPAYESIAQKMGSTCVPVPMTPDMRLDLRGFAEAVTDKTKVMFLCNPNNPTGIISTRTEVETLLNAVPDDVLVVIDEAYYEYVVDPNYPDSTSYLGAHANLVVIRTFSKAMGMAGIRIGYAVAAPDIIRVMLRIREVFPVNRIAEAGAVAALDDKKFITETVRLTREGREQFYSAFSEMGLRYYPSQTNFMFVDLGQPSEPVAKAMLRHGVRVRPLAVQGVPNAMRISIGTAAQNEVTIRALKKALGR